MPLSKSLPLELMLTQWASQLEPLIGNPLNSVLILKNVELAMGDTVINHRLGKTQQGWFLVDIDGAATVYRSAAFNALTLTLNSSAAVTVSLGVF